MKYKTKIAALLLFFSVSSLCAEGAEKQRAYTRFTFGVESSYVLTFLNYSHFNFISADGDRRDERYTTMNVFNNGQILLHAGVNMSENLNLSLYAGYSGVYRHERMIPLSLRLSWYSGKDPMADRWILFCSAGTGFNDFGTFINARTEILLVFTRLCDPCIAVKLLRKVDVLYREHSKVNVVVQCLCAYHLISLEFFSFKAAPCAASSDHFSLL